MVGMGPTRKGDGSSMVLICKDGTRPSKPGTTGKPSIDPCHDGNTPPLRQRSRWWDDETGLPVNVTNSASGWA